MVTLGPLSHMHSRCICHQGFCGQIPPLPQRGAHGNVCLWSNVDEQGKFNNIHRLITSACKAKDLTFLNTTITTPIYLYISIPIYLYISTYTCETVCVWLMHPKTPDLSIIKAVSDKGILKVKGTFTGMYIYIKKVMILLASTFVCSWV